MWSNGIVVSRIRSIEFEIFRLINNDFMMLI